MTRNRKDEIQIRDILAVLAALEEAKAEKIQEMSQLAHKGAFHILSDEEKAEKVEEMERLTRELSKIDEHIVSIEVTEVPLRTRLNACIEMAKEALKW